jgi:pimeloyl-ACP methyl ester carboxylesterase
MRAWDIRDVTLPDGRRLRMRCWPGRGHPLVLHSLRGFAHRPVDFDGSVAGVWGARDALVPVGHAGALRRALPQAHVEIWEGMGHHPQRERPVALARFIERHASGGAEQAGARAA